MKVNVDIEALERKIALHWHLRLFGGGFTEDREYHRGCLDAYSDILCGYLGINEANEIVELEEKCYEKWKDAGDQKGHEINQAWAAHNAEVNK